MPLPYFLEPHNLRRRLVPAVIAVVVAAVAWVGIGPLLTGEDDEPALPIVEEVAPAPEPVPQVEPEPPAPAFPEVLVAKGEVAAGTLLRAESIEWREWREPVDPTSAALRDIVSEGAVVGSVATRTLQDGDMITWDSIMVPGHPGFISATLKRGMVAVTVEVDRATTDASIIYPGDRVDIILTTTGSAGSGPSSLTIVRDSRVLAVGSTVLALGRYGRPNLTEIGRIAPVDPPDGTSYTVEVGPADAQRIAAAVTGGRLTLAMRSINDPSSRRTSAVPARFDDLIPPPEEPDDIRVRIIRGGRPAQQPGESA
ncbi:MAG: Flp pilus assembly protein CpaB [Gammaproteobacteria bacterium]|nr:Flp pilus assembly protein CpaB [Gammaproteobacteria bacterium]